MKQPSEVAGLVHEVSLEAADIELLRGPQGPQGLKGDTGATGPQGPKGPQGPAGSAIVAAMGVGAYAIMKNEGSSIAAGADVLASSAGLKAVIWSGGVVEESAYNVGKWRNMSSVAVGVGRIGLFLRVG